MEFSTEKTESKTFEPIPAGTYEARVVRIVDLGIQKPTPPWHLTKEGKPKSPQQAIQVTFEILDDSTGSDSCRFAFKKMSLSMDERSHFSKIVASAGLAGTGKASLADLISTPVSLTLEVNGQYNNIKSISPVSERLAKTLPNAKASTYVFSFSDPDRAVYEMLSTKSKDKIAEAVNFKGSKVEKMLLNAAPQTANVTDMNDIPMDDEI